MSKNAYDTVKAFEDRYVDQEALEEEIVQIQAAAAAQRLDELEQPNNYIEYES